MKTLPFYRFTEEEIKRHRLVRQQTTEWKNMRSVALSIGSSEVPAVCRASVNCSVQELWRRKTTTGNVPVISTFQQSLFDHGHRAEPHARRWLSEELGEHIWESGIWVHPEFQLLMASVDGVICSLKDGLIPVELKCPLTTTTLNVKRRHQDWLQLQTHIMCTRAHYGYMCYYFGENDERNEYSLVLANPVIQHQILVLTTFFIADCISCFLPVTAAFLQRYYKEYEAHYELATDSFAQGRDSFADGTIGCSSVAIAAFNSASQATVGDARPAKKRGREGAAHAPKRALLSFFESGKPV